MPTRTNRKAASVARQATDLAIAAPQVVAYRVARMAVAGPNPSERDRKEFSRMVSEKQTAFHHAGTAMALQSVVAGQTMMTAWMRMWSAPWGSAAWNGNALAAQWQNAAWGVVDKGLTPVRRTAVANAKRLARG